MAMNLYAGRGVTVREYPLTWGSADYLLFVDRQAVGVTRIEEARAVVLEPDGSLSVLSGTASSSEWSALADVRGLDRPPPSGRGSR